MRFFANSQALARQDFTVEKWSRDGNHIEKIVASTGSIDSSGLTYNDPSVASGLQTGSACACIASLQQLPESFGAYTGLLTQPRVMQFALRYEF